MPGAPVLRSGLDQVEQLSFRRAALAVLLSSELARVEQHEAGRAPQSAPSSPTVSASCRRAAIGTCQLEALIDRCRLFFSGPLASKSSRVPSVQFGIAMGFVSLSTAKPFRHENVSIWTDRPGLICSDLAEGNDGSL